MKIEQIEFEILNAYYWEHFKASKDLEKIYPVDHPKRVELLNTLNEIQPLLKKIKERR